jgi:hypothetical protein
MLGAQMVLALIVSSIAIGSAVLIGVLGYLIDKGAETEEHKATGKGA